jgi:hypothetical protein
LCNNLSDNCWALAVGVVGEHDRVGEPRVVRHVFVDETKQHGYVVAAAVVVEGDLEPLRRVVAGLVLPGQRRLHMKTERDSRRRQIVAALVEAGVEVVVYDAGRRYRTDLQARGECLRGVVADAARWAGSTRLVLEQDDSLVRWDSQRLIELAREAGCRDRLRYGHERAAAEALLAVPDAVAWCWGRGGDWRRRVEPLVSTVHQV